MPSDTSRIRNLVLSAVLVSLLSSCAKEVVRPQPAVAPRVEVLSCRLAANGEFVEVRYSLHVTAEFAPNSPEAYLLDEATGEKFFVMRLQRVGLLSDKAGAEGKAARSVIFRNREGRLKPGSLVTLIVGSIRQEHVPLEK
jgi:hypothetical protein